MKVVLKKLGFRKSDAASVCQSPCVILQLGQLLKRRVILRRNRIFIIIYNHLPILAYLLLIFLHKCRRVDFLGVIGAV